MKRRDFIKTGTAVGTGAILSSLVEGCSSNGDSVQKSSSKNIETIVTHNLFENPKLLSESLSPEEQNLVNEYLPEFDVTESVNHSIDDEVFVANPGAKKMAMLNTPQLSSGFLQASSNDDATVQYSSKASVNKEGYTIHMYYKKIVGTYVSSDSMFTEAYSIRNMTQDKDEVLEDNLPKYKLSYLVLVVPNGDDSDEEIVVLNPIRETVKTLLFRSSAFSHFSQEDMRYVLDKFDTIFKEKTQLEMMIQHVGMDNWFRYALHKNHAGEAVLRKTETLDSDGNVIHAIGDAIYTYPIRDILAQSLKNDHNFLVNSLSMDERIAPLLMPKDDTDSSREAMWRSALQRRASEYDGHTYKVSGTKLSSVGGKIEMDSVDKDGVYLGVSNHYNRHMTVAHMELNSDETAYNGNSIIHDIILPPRYSILSVPIGDSRANITVPFSEKAASTRVFFSSWSFIDGSHTELYKREDGSANEVQVLKNLLEDSELMTIVFELALPTALIAWGGLHISQGPSWRKLLAQYGVQFAYDIASPIVSDSDLSASEAMNAIVGPLVSHIFSGIGEIVAYIMTNVIENEAEDAVPIAGQIYRSLCLLANISNLAQSLYALSTLKAVEYVDVKRYHTLKISLRSDANDHGFPNDLSEVDIFVTYSDGVNPTHHKITWDSTNVVAHTVDGGGSYATYEIELEEQPSGGDAEIHVAMKRDNWVAAHAKQTIDTYTNDAIEVAVTNNLIKLTGNSIYEQYAKLTNDGSAYKWNVKGKDETLTSPVVSDDILGQNELFKISVNDPIGAIGYSYRSLETNKYNVKNVSAVLETPNQGVKSHSSTDMIQISYSLLSHKSNEGSVIFEKKDGVTYIRKIDINSVSNDFEIDFSKNIGTFITDSVTQFGYYQPEKIIAALDTDSGVLHIINHLANSVADSSTDRYTNVKGAPLTIKLNADVDPTTQYLYNPKLLTVSPVGEIIILEETKTGETRLRAFDRYGRVDLAYSGFNNDSGVFELPKEDLSVTYLDISIEAKGFIYILKRIGSDPTNEANYLLDIYDPFSDNPNKPLVTTTGMSGGKIVVDFWRSVYTLNYETNALDEPTISLWLPPV